MIGLFGPIHESKKGGRVESLAGLFSVIAVGTIGFYLFLLVFVAVMGSLVHFKRGTGATITLIATVVLFHLFGSINLLVMLKDHWGWFLTGAVGYLLIAAAWSLFKNSIHIYELGLDYRRMKVNFLRDQGKPEEYAMQKDDVLRAKWIEAVDYSGMQVDRNEWRPSFNPDKNIDTIIMWAGHWPFSLVETAASFLGTKVYDFMFETLRSQYVKSEKNGLGRYAGDLVPVAVVISRRGSHGITE